MVSHFGPFDDPYTPAGQEYDSLAARIRRNIQLVREANAIFSLPEGIGSQGAYDEAVRLGIVGPVVEVAGGATVPGNFSMGLSGAAGRRDVPLSVQIDEFIELANQRIKSDVERALLIDPVSTMADFGTLGYIPPDLLDSLFGGGGGGFQPAPFQFQVGPGGQVVVFDPNTGNARIAGTFPELATDTQVMQDPRTGNLVAISPSTGEVETLIEGFGFPELDPRVVFETETALAQQQIALQLQGLELSRRGMMIDALGTDFANQIALGRMRYEEASLRLDTIDRALSQRRAEREAVLQFGVTRASLRTRDGETVTMLPGGAQLAAILSQATGQHFGPEIAELGVTSIDPDATAQAVMQAGAFASPLSGLLAGLDANRSLINSLLGAPLGTETVAQEATQMIAEGI